MRRRLVLSSILFLAPLLAILACQREAPRPPLVLLISVDTLRRDALRAFDPSAPPLPNLDAFAAESARFERAASSASWTLPAHASMLTGLYPGRHGATDPRVALATEVGTLAEQLREHGYETVGITQGGYLDRRFGFGRGFDRYVDAPAQAATVANALGSVFDDAAALVAARSDARPLFLFLQTFSVHDYFLLRPWAVAALAEKPSRTPKEYIACLQGTRSCDAAEWALLRELYAAETRNLDACFGRLRSALEAAGKWQDAVILLTSDHGEGFDPARHRIHHGGRLQEDLVRIPMLVHGPAIAPRAIETPASLIDVAPTLLALAGIDAPGGLDGVSLAPLLHGGNETGPARALFATEHYESWLFDTRIRSEAVSARPLSIALIEGDRWYLRAGKREAVYDVATDPHQERDLSRTATDLAQLRKRSETRDVDRIETPLVENNEDLKARLRALGYAE